jgi:LysM repeat protein
MLPGRIGTAALVAAALATVVVGKLQAQSLKGSQSSVNKMYTFAIQSGFDFFGTTSAVNSAVNSGRLVKLASNSDYALHDVEHPFVKEEARLFVERLGSQYRDNCGEALVVTGATRPLNMKLANASDHSVHPTGMAVDLRRPKTTKCQKWLRTTLTSLEKAGVIEATEEKRPPHFHVAVFPRPYARYVEVQSSAAPSSSAPLVSPTRIATSGPSQGAEVQVVSYNVRSGDSLWSIATKHDTTVVALRELNKLSSSKIYPGQAILVPTVVQGSSPR